MTVADPQSRKAAGLHEDEARERLRHYGANQLPEPRLPSLVTIFLRQFLSPLIYTLLAAALVSVAVSDVEDAVFIGIVLLINGIVGTAQEYSAGRAAFALRRLEQPRATVIRDSRRSEVDARTLVPGDVVLIEAGSRVPADIELVTAEDLLCDESLLTGESAPVRKNAATGMVGSSTSAFASTFVTRGRGSGIVVATGAVTAVGQIAQALAQPSLARPPLMLRLDRFSHTIAVAVGLAVVLLVAVGLLRDMGLHELFLMAVGLAVSAIPEGLPVAVSVALAIGMRRMSRAGAIVRSMPAIEALGSCTMIATDKTGTLTLNELTVTEVRLPEGVMVAFEARHDLDTCSLSSPTLDEQSARKRTASLLRAACLPNEGTLLRDGDGWTGIGDAVDVALLAAACKGGTSPEDLKADHPLAARIPYEPDLKYAASFHRAPRGASVFVKGAPETLIAMADRMDCGTGGVIPIDRLRLLRQKDEMARRGLRVLAFAEGAIETEPAGNYGQRHLVSLIFLGYAGMEDPVRPEVPLAVANCYRAGVAVVMITGDDPQTAGAIARRAGIHFDEPEVTTGEAVSRVEAQGEAALDALTCHVRVYARVAPGQKLAIVLSLARNGHFVAMTGDGANDAPALKHAHVGVAMGRKGTDLARESADIVLTDDNFASIVAGISEGRVAYANIRKVIFMLVSTGFAEVVLFMLAIPLGLPMPLLPVQLLWLNLVTNGVQDVALAAECAEGDELSYAPRRPREPIFDRIMIRRIWHSALVMGLGGFAVFYWLLTQGNSVEQARNLLLLLFVIFENVQTFNSRSERRSVFRRGFLSNPVLVFGVVAAQGLHVGAMYVPHLSETLRIFPVSPFDWSLLLLPAAALLLVMEFEKWRERRSPRLKACRM